MANNEYVNKVQFGDTTIMDISDTTAEAGDVIEGEVFYTRSGAQATGTLGDATTSAHGLMSAVDKTKLDSIDMSSKVNINQGVANSGKILTVNSSGNVDLTTNICTDHDVTILTSDWTLHVGETPAATYIWTHSVLNSACVFEIDLNNGSEDFGLDEFEAVKSYDSTNDRYIITFSCDGTPKGKLAMTIHIWNAATEAFQSFSADEVSSQAITDCDTVEEALSALDNNIYDVNYKHTYYAAGEHIYLPYVIYGYATSTSNIRVELISDKVMVSTLTYTPDFTLTNAYPADSATAATKGTLTYTFNRRSGYQYRIDIGGFSGLATSTVYRLVLDVNRRIAITS